MEALEDIDLKQKYFYIEIVEIRKESLKEVLKKGYKEMYEDSLRISEEWQSAEDEASNPHYRQKKTYQTINLFKPRADAKSRQGIKN